MSGRRIRMRIDYRSGTSGRVHSSERLVSSSLELLDRFLRLRTKVISAMHIKMKLKGHRSKWKLLATSSPVLSECCLAGLFDPARFRDKEYMEGVLVEAYERAVEIRKD